MTQSRSTKPKRVPERQCVACRALKPRTELIRLVRLPEGDVALDLKNQHHGRGAYVCRGRPCVERAAKARIFHKALRRNVPDDLINDVIALGQEMS
ncbi:hypothetical protein D3C72_816140 [compost metagenome]